MTEQGSAATTPWFVKGAVAVALICFTFVAVVFLIGLVVAVGGVL